MFYLQNMKSNSLITFLLIYEKLAGHTLTFSGPCDATNDAHFFQRNVIILPCTFLSCIYVIDIESIKGQPWKGQNVMFKIAWIQMSWQTLVVPACIRSFLLVFSFPVLQATENLPSLQEKKEAQKLKNNCFVFFLLRRLKSYPPLDGKQKIKLEWP